MRKKVLVSTLLPTIGGTTTMVAKIVEYLQERDLRVQLAHYMPYSIAPELSVPSWKLLARRPGVREELVFGGVESFQIGVRLPELEWTHYLPNEHWAKLMAENDYHVAVAGSALAAAPMALTGRPCLAWIATPYLEDRVDRVRKFPWYRKIIDKGLDAPIASRLEKKVLGGVEALALSRYTAAKLRALAPSCRVSTMPMPIDTKKFYPGQRAGRTPRRLGFSGRFTDPRKNVGLLLEVVAACVRQGQDVVLELVGDEPDAMIQSQARRLEIEGRITYRPHVDRSSLRAFYDGLDLFVMTSHQEGLGIVGLEAMACGCPVISTRCGGPEDYVKDGVNGFLTAFDATQIAERVVRVLRDDGLRADLSRGAHRTIADGYTDAHVKRIFWSAFERAFGVRHREDAQAGRAI